MPRTAARPDPFRAISDGNRRALLDILREGEQPVGALAERAGLSYSLASQHLQVLLEADAVVRRAAGRRRIYSLEPAPLRLVHDWTAEYERFWEERLGRLRRRLGE